MLIAPIDREDLFRLSRSIDDVLDNLRDFTREWDLFGIEAAKAYLSLLNATGAAIADLQLAVQAVARDPGDVSGCSASKEIGQGDPPAVRRRAAAGSSAASSPWRS